MAFRKIGGLHALGSVSPGLTSLIVISVCSSSPGSSGFSFHCPKSSAACFSWLRNSARRPVSTL